MRIRITVGEVSLEAELNDTPTARKIAEILPFEGPFNTWGDEIYFEIPVQAELEQGAKETKSFLPVLVNIIGRVLDDATMLKQVMNKEKIRLEAL